MDYSEMSENLRLRYYERIQDEIAGNRNEVQLMMERSYSSACMILEHVESVSLPEFAIRSSIFGQEFRANKFSCLYADQMRLAKCDPEQFVFGLHSFYDKMTDRVRRNKDFSKMADLIGAIKRAHIENRAVVGSDVADAYVDLALQTLEYLRPKKYDMESCIYGVSTTGEPLGGPYPLPYSDVPGIEIQRELLNGKRYTSQDEYLLDMQKRYAVYGLPIRNIGDLDSIQQIQRTHINTVAALLPLINEYTWDMAPIIPCTARIAPLASLSILPIDLGMLKDKLGPNRIPLPKEGVEIQFVDPEKSLQRLILKETQHNGKPYILYRFAIHGGRFYGYYDIHDGFLYSILQEAISPIPLKNFTALFLVLYAFLALPNPGLPELNTIFKQHGQPLLIQIPDYRELHGR